VAEVVAKLRLPPSIVENMPLRQNLVRFRLSPDFAISLAAGIRAPEGLAVQPVELEVASTRTGPLDAYESLLGDAMRGDSFRFACEEEVEEAWRIVDPAIQANTPLHEYEPGTWGPKAAEELVRGGWFAAAS